MLADCVDHDQIASEQYDQGVHCLPVILLNAHNILIQKYMVNEQAFPLKWNLKNNTSQVSFGAGKNACFFLMYQVDSGHLHFTSKKTPGHLHFTSKKTPVCDIDYHKISE